MKLFVLKKLSYLEITQNVVVVIIVLHRHHWVAVGVTEPIITPSLLCQVVVALPTVQWHQYPHNQPPASCDRI